MEDLPAPRPPRRRLPPCAASSVRANSNTSAASSPGRTTFTTTFSSSSGAGSSSNAGFRPIQPKTNSWLSSMETASSSGSLRLGSEAAVAVAVAKAGTPLLAAVGSVSKLRVPPLPPRRRPPASIPLGLDTSALAEATERTKPGSAANGCRLSFPGRVTTWPKPPQLGQALPNNSYIFCP